MSAAGADPRSEDRAARLAACTQFDAPLLVEAGAGTGKTATLVARIVSWAMDRGWSRAVERRAGLGDAPSAGEIAADVLGRIAAITFTEAAAAEMADRVGRALVAVESGSLPHGLSDERLPAAREERSLRARALIGALDHLVVRTIHAWCRRLLARRPLEAGLHPAFEVDAEEAVQQSVVREVLEAILRSAYSGEQYSALLALAREGFGPSRVEEALGALIRAGVSPDAFAADPLDPGRVARAAAATAAAARALELALDGRLSAARNTGEALKALPATLASIDSVGADPAALAERLREIWGPVALRRLREWGRGSFTKGDESNLGARCDAVTRAARSLHTWVANWLDFDRAGLERARRALAPLLEAATRELRRRGVLGFADLLQEARTLLRAHAGVRSQVRRELDLLLVDEFQDTDPVQCEILRWVALDGPVEERPSLFLVGDPKQSIYGWRSADLRAYDAFARDLVAAGGEVRRLVVNHRSVPAVLDEVEAILAPAMHREEGLQPAFEPLLPSEEHRDEAGFRQGTAAPVEHWISWLWDAEAQEPDVGTRVAAAADLEAAALARDLSALHHEHGVAWGEVAVLFRTTGDLDRYLDALRRAGVPYTVERDRSYYRRREIIEAAAAVRCVLDPNDPLALLSFLRSAYVGVPDAALVPLWTRHLPEKVSRLSGVDAEALDELREVVTEAGRSLPEDVPGLDRLAGWESGLLFALESLALLRASFEADPADVFVEKLRALLLMEVTEASRFLGIYRAANLERFFQELAGELAGGSDPEALLRRLRVDVQESREAEAARPRDTSLDAVRVMTIHKAKGLDFEHVYVMQLHKEVRGPGGPPPAAVVEEMDGLLEMRLFGVPTPGFAAWALRSEARAAAERVRELYVAATRAKRRLVLAGRWTSRTGSLVGILAEHRAEPADLERWMGELAGAGDRDFVDADGARWKFPALAGPAPPRRGGAAARGDEGDLRVRAERVEDLWRRADGAAATMARGRSRAASALGRADRDGDAEPDIDRLEPRAAGRHDEGDENTRRFSPAGRSAAQSAGTAVHKALEAFDFAAPHAATELARLHSRLDDWLGDALVGSARAAARARAGDILERFGRGKLFRPFASLADRLVAREL
ncbi:MAG: UvrD-helicase domain-containing protein, partial [Proteobacteria bacterium]|nr:UvrD-helicase domain-containing protein [Pseudomonadota bacterium]